MDRLVFFSNIYFFHICVFCRLVQSQTCGQCAGSCESQNCVNGCIPGFYLTTCTQPCGKCAGNGTCKQSSGFCNMQSCLSGYFGLLCIQKCPSNCGGDGSCHFITANCLQGCTLGFTGVRCGIACPTSNCKDPCEALNGGICSSGCNSGFYGERCTQLCNCPNNGICNQDSGACARVSISQVTSGTTLPGTQSRSTTRSLPTLSTVAGFNDKVTSNAISTVGLSGSDVPINNTTALVVGLSVSLVVVLVLILVVVSLCLERFKRKERDVHVYECHIKPQSEGNAVYYDSLELPAENDYVEICSTSDIFTTSWIQENNTTPIPLE